MACDVNVGMCADGSQARKELKKTRAATKSFGKGAMQSFKQLAAAAGLAGGAYLAIRKMTEFIKGSLTAYKDFEDSITRLNAVVESTGGAAGYTTDEMIKMADGLQKVTTFSNTAIMSAQGMLSTFTSIGEEAFPRVLESAMDVSEVMGQDMKSSIVQLGKALNDPIANLGALGRTGIQFTKDQKELIKSLWETGQQAEAQAVILKELNRQFGGVARAAKDTFGGAIKSLKNNFSDLQRMLGQLMVEEGGLKDLLAKINEFIEVPENMRNVIRVFQSLGLIMVTSFRVSIMQITLFIKGLKLIWNAAMDVGRVIGRVFNPKNWKPGEMKKALAEVSWSIKEDFMSMGDTVVNFGQKTRDSFMKILDPELPKMTIEPTKKAITALTEEQKKLNEEVEEAVKITVLNGQALRDHIMLAESAAQQIESQRQSEAWLSSTITEQTEALWNNYDAWKALQSMHLVTTAQTKELTWAEQTLADMNFEVGKSVMNSVVPAFEAFSDNTAKIKDILSDFIKTAIANLFKSLGAYLAQMAVLFALSLQLGKAALAAAGAAAAYAAAGKVAAMQQGGTARALPGYGGGDQVPALLEPGEMVIRKENVARNRAELTRMQGGQGGSLVIYNQIGTKLIGRSITHMINDSKRIKVKAKAVVGL